ncbi:TPA: TrkA C-terminal domain-containing protein [Enterococcus faecium]
MGVDIKVSQADILSSVIIDQISLEDMVTLAHLNQGNNAIVEMTIRENAQADHSFIKDLEIPLDTVIIAVTRNKEALIPKGDTQLLSGDRLLLYTGEQGEKDLLKLLR